MKQTNDLMHHGLNGQPETITTVAHRTTRHLHQPLKTAILLLALIMGWGNSSVWADTEHDIWTGNAINTWVNLSSDKFNGCNVSTDVLRLYTTDGAISSFCTQWGQNVLNPEATTMPSGYYNLDLACYQIPLTDFVSDFITKLATQGGLNIYVIDGHYLTRVSIATPATDPFINSTSPDAKGTGTKEVAEDTTHPTWESFSLSELTTNNTGATAFSTLGDIKYIRVYVKEGNTSVAYDSQVNGQTVDLLQVTAGAGVTVAPAAAAGETADPKNGLNVYNGGTALNLSDITVTLNAGENHLKDYKIIVLLSTSALTNEGNEPTWDFEYTYTFTYPSSTLIIPFSIDEPTAVSKELNVQSRVLSDLGMTLNEVAGSLYSRWYVQHKTTKVKQPLSKVQNNPSQTSTWLFQVPEDYDWPLVDGNYIRFYTGQTRDANTIQQWSFNSHIGKITVYAPEGYVLSDCSDYQIVCEVSGHYTALDGSIPDPDVMYVWSIVPNVQFEGDANTNAVSDATGTQKVNAAAASVSLDLTGTGMALAHTKVASADVRYARFYLTDASGTIVDPTGKLEVKYNGTTISANCPKTNQGFYVYTGGTLDKTKFSVTLTAPNAYEDYKVVALFAVDPLTNINATGTTVTEEPDYDLLYTYSFEEYEFEGDANNGATVDSGEQKVNGTAASVNVDLTTMALANVSGYVKYARFYLTDATGTPVDPSGKLTVTYNGTNGTSCTPSTLGYYVYDSGNDLNTSLMTVSLTAPNAYENYKVVALFAVEPLQNIESTGSTVYEEPDYDLMYTYSFSNYQFEYTGTVTNTPITQQFATAEDDISTVTLDWDLLDPMPSGIKYARFYVVDATGNAVDASDASHQLTVADGTLCGNPVSGYYIYTGDNLTLGTVTLSSSGGSVLPYKVVCWLATSEEGILKNGTTVLEEPNITNGYAYSFKRPVAYIEETGSVEWSPVSMFVDLDSAIDTYKGRDYLASLDGNYHVLWTVEDNGTIQTLEEGSARQDGKWTYSVDGDNATFYAPTGQTFADMANVRIIARLYETATGENDADKSLTYTVSIVKTGFFGELKDPTQTGSTTIALNEDSLIPVSVPLGNATTAFSGAKYARVWLTQSGELVAPTGKLALPTGMIAFGTNHSATYGYYIYDANGISLSDADLKLAARADYPQYQVHIALSADAPISYVDFARSSGPLRAPSDAHEPDYDYEYTINFSYQDNSMRVIKIYEQASENTSSENITEHHGNNYTTNFKSQIEAAFAELGITLDANTTFTKWDVVKEGNLVDLKHDYAAPNTIWIEHNNQYLFANHYQDGNKQYGYWSGGNTLSLDDNLNATIHFGNGVFQLGSIIECWVTNVNSQSNADPTGGYLVKVEVIFNEDGNPPYTFINETDIAATKKMVDVSTLSASSPVFDMTDALVSGAQYARIYLAKYGDANNASSDLTVTYNGNAATACADPYGRYGWYISDTNGIDLENLIVGSTTLTADDMLKYNLVVVSSTSPLSGDQEPAWEQKTVYSFQKEVMARIYAEEGTETSIAGELLNNPSGSYTLGQDILRRIDATVSDFSNTLYVKWYVEDKNGVRQAVNGGGGSSSSSWNFDIEWNGSIRDWVVGDHQLQYYTNQNANSSPNEIEQNGWTGQITTLDNIYIQVPGYLHNYMGYRIVYEFSDEYDTADGADPGFRLRYVYTITDPNDFEGIKNSGGAEVEVTQTVNRTAEKIDLTLDDNNAFINSGWAFEHEKLATRWEYQGTWPGGQWVQVQIPLRYARFYLIDAEGNQVDPTGKLTVTYGGDNATVTACTAPEQGFYIFGEGGTTINKNQVTVSLAAPREYKLYKVVCVFSTALDGIVPEDLSMPLQREPDYDLKYTYSFDYPTPTTKEINITVPWSKTGMRLRANTDADGALLTTTSVDDAWGITFPELSAGQYVRWYVQRRQGPGNNYTRQQLVSGSERTNGAWALNTASVYEFLDRTNQQGGDQAVLTGRTDFTEANWNDVWSSPTIYAPTGRNYDNPEVRECRFVCEVYADDIDNGNTPYVRYVFTMVRFLGDPKDNAGESEETIMLDRDATSVDLSLQEVFANAKAQVNNRPIYYVRVWLTKSDGTPVNPAGALNWQQVYNGSNQVNTFNSTAPQNPVYGYYFCSSDIGYHSGGVEGLDAAATLTLPVGHFSQYQVHVALSADEPTGMRWNNTTSRWEFANEHVGRPTQQDPNVLEGDPAEPDYDYVYTFKFDYGFEAHNIKTVKTKYKTVIYDETTRKFTPRLFQNWLEVAADCDVQRQELADNAYARWYLEDLEGNLIQIEELTSPKSYTSLGNPYGYYRYKFNVNDFNDTKGLTDNGYNPTITLPGGYTYNQVRLVCVVTTKTEPQTDNPDVPYDIPATEPQELQVKYIYTLVKSSDFTNLPFIHYQGEAYKWLTQMGRTDEANADRDYIIVNGEAGATELSWDFENTKVSEETFGNIRQSVHTVDYYVYFDPSDYHIAANGTGLALMLPSQHYFGGGNDTEPRAYYRWYDYKTDVKASCLTAYGTELHLYPNDPDATAEKAGDPSRGLFAMLLRNTDNNPCDGNIGVRFHAPDGWNANSEEILVACDVSRYMDGMDDSFTYLLHEPTLSVRYLFHILPAQKIAGDIAAAATVTIGETTYTGLAAVEQNLQAQYEAEDTELYEYNGRTVVSLNGTTGSFTMRSDLQKLDSYWIYDSNNNLVNCSNLQWYAYYRDADGKVWKLKVGMNGRETSRLALYELSDFAGTYSEVGGSGTKTISADDLLGDRLYMVGCMGNGVDEAPVVWNEVNFIDAKPLLIGTEGTVEERTDQYMRSEYTLAQVLDFNDFFDEDERFNKPTASYENYAKVPITWPNAQYGFCYPQLYGLCGTNKYGNWGVYGVSPTHGDYTLLKSMNLPGVSADENFTEQSLGSQWWWNEPLYDVTHTRAANGNVATDTNDYGTFLYVDASDEARVIAELEFDAALCADAEIYYTAYVADMTNNVTRPQVRFRVSTDVEVDGVRVRVPVVTFETGNIVSEGASTGFWHQVYGYTVLPNRLHHILNGTSRHYYVSVENSCENTDGADYTVDQISFYTHQASVKAKIVSDICDDGPVRVKIVAEAEQLLKSLKALTTAATKDIFFCIAERYDDLNHELHAEDIVTGNGIYTDQNDQPNNEYGVISVPLNLDLLTNVTTLHDGTKQNSGFYYDATDDVVYFQLDEREFALEPGKKYFVSIYDMAENRVGGLNGWGTPYSGNACSVYSNDISPNRMYVDLTVDGQTTDGHIEFGCNASSVTKRFDIAINYPTGDGYDKYTYFKYDYFELAEGKTITDFKNIKDENDIYLEDALATFREWMRNDQAGLPEEEKDYAVPGTVYSELPRPAEDATEYMAMYNIIKKYMDGFEGAEGKLYLSATSGIERTFTDAGIYKYLAIPLTKEIPTGGEICSPIEFEFNVDASYGGPEIMLGFDDVTYPDDYKRVIRAGLEQLSKMKSESYMLHIPISSYHNKGQGMGARIYFQNTNLYLCKTNDPTIPTNDDGVPTNTTIKVAEIKVPEDATGTAYVGPDRMYLPVDFSESEVTFHEGYWYEVNTSFIDETDAAETNPCVGDLYFILKVVPEFATWYAQPIENTQNVYYNANWYNDQNWLRSVRAELYKDDIATRNQNTSTLGHPDGYQDDSEIDALLTGDPGFVPMKFTYVTLLGNNHAPSLIKEPKVSTSSSQQGGGLLDPNQTRMLTDPSPYTNQVSSQPTENIRYDMLVRYGAHSEGGEGCFGHRLMTLNQAGKYVWGNDPRSEEQMETFNTNRKAFDVEKFYGNICREVYFKPGAELLRQQRLSYNRAWVEKEVEANKWYLVSSPLKETYAGDMYVPATMSDLSMETPADKAGRQMTEAFQPINFSTSAVSADADHTITSQPAYSRTKYPIYQRSWNKDGAKVYTKTNDARATDYSANLNYQGVTSVDIEWSHTFNDVQVPYTTLTGFSIRPHKKDQTDNTLIRLPKADTEYDYYQWDNTSPADGKLTHSVTRTTTATTSYPLPSRYTSGITDQYRFVVDDPKADGLLTVNISDLQQQDGYILVGNPHMASLRMDEFFKGNPGLAPSYWTYEGSVASAALATPTVITATGDDNADGIIRPLQAFFVKKKTASELDEGEDEATAIVFTRAMTIDGNYPAIPETSPSRQLTLSVADTEGASSAVVQLSDEADGDYREGEDVETLFDTNLADVPMVYTVAGGQAVSIDQRPSLDLVAFGVVKAQDDPVEVTLTLDSSLLTPHSSVEGESSVEGDLQSPQLYFIDAVTGEQTLITDGTTLTIQPNDYGRYFLSTTAIKADSRDEQTLVISVRQQEVTVTASSTLKMVRATTLGGVTAYDGGRQMGNQCRFQLSKGVYIIQATTTTGQQRQMKVIVK